VVRVLGRIRHLSDSRRTTTQGMELERWQIAKDLAYHLHLMLVNKAGRGQIPSS
jgi:hypothetical protein